MIKLAALQYSPERTAVASNIERMSVLLREITADIVVLPELAPTGYFYTTKEELIDLAEHPEDGAFCIWARRMASERGMVVVGGFAERDGRDRLFNSALIALPDESYAVYRKTHLFYKEKIVFEPGDSGFFVREWNGVRIGTMICYDWRFPEAARALALRGADIVAHPSNLVAAADVWGPAMAIRALENKVIVVTANRSGSERVGEETLTFSGESRIIAMNGQILSLAGPEDETVITAEADPHATRRKSFNDFNDIFADRRPEMY